MKTKFYFGAFAALALGFASCSSDEPINGPVTDSDGPAVGESYMAIRITNVGSNGRALPTDNDFENPAGEAESKFDKDNVRFYFFTADDKPFIMTQNGVNGTVSNTNMVAPVDITSPDGSFDPNTPGNPGDVTGVLVLGAPEKYIGNKPAKVVCIVNPHEDVHPFEYYANKTLDALREITADVPNEFTKFTMTSSTYAVDGKSVCYTDVTDYIFTTADEAKNHPAKIFVERLAAKVRVKGLQAYTVKSKTETGGTVSTKEAEFTIRGLSSLEGYSSDKTQLSMSLEGWMLIKNAKNTYAIKNIDECIKNAPFADWNDPTRHRSYWAWTACAGESDFWVKEYNIHTGNFSLGNFNSTYPTQNVAYCYGNTRFSDDITSATDRTSNATAILVKGTVKLPGKDDGLDIVNWAGDYYLTSEFKKVVVAAWNADNPTRQVNADAIEFTAKGSTPNTWKAVVKLSGTESQTYDRFDNISWWKDGVTSYYVNIKHMGEKFGVVRNHIYDYEFTDVIGLGVPGNDPQNPQDPESNYLAAVVYCLNWNVVSNSTVLE